MELQLFTDTYPYGYGEPFLEDELPVLAANFERIVIHPLHKEPGPVRALPEGVYLDEPLLDFSPTDRKKLLMKGLFNKAPLSLWEYFRGAAFLSKSKTKVFLSYWLLKRSLWKTAAEFVKKTGDQPEICYFYWGDKTVQIWPAIKRWAPQYSGVVRLHGSDLFEEVKGFLPFRKEYLSAADLLVPVSQTGAIYLRTHYPYLDPFKVQPFPLGFSNSTPYQNKLNEEGVFEVVSCSNVIPLKRVHFIARALDRIRVSELTEGKFQKIRWTHFGNGYSMTQLQKEVLSLKNNELEVVLAGRKDRAEVLQYYKEHSIDLFVNVSTSEGVPVSIMEAMSFGIPVIATAVGGTPELVVEQAGMTIPPQISSTDLKGYIESYMAKSYEERSKLSLGAYQAWKGQWDAETNAKNFTDYLHSIFKF